MENLAQQLKQNNYLTYYGKIIKVSGTVGNTIYHAGGFDSNYPDSKPFKPIPLTEEILIKCGFEKNVGDFIYPINGTDMFFLYKYEDSEIVYLCYWDDNLLEIKYLHQLQNLIFALTQKELECIL